MAFSFAKKATTSDFCTLGLPAFFLLLLQQISCSCGHLFPFFLLYLPHFILPLESFDSTIDLSLLFLSLCSSHDDNSWSRCPSLFTVAPLLSCGSSFTGTSSHDILLGETLLFRDCKINIYLEIRHVSKNLEVCM
uniref:Uncharacterized protein n=1 Tax=Aegilops tauschii subsp. strangulata TaxID=200361 RepID=A0A453C3Y7_AEGTS